MDRKSLKNFLKRQTFTICSCLIVIITSSALISSALFTYTNKDNNNQVVNSGNFAITFSGQNNNIDTQNTFISSDEEGLQTNGYDFTVTNNGNIKATYNIMLGRDNSTVGNLVDTSYIRYSIDNGPARSLGDSKLASGDNNANYMYLLKSVNADSNKTNSHNIKVWIVESAPDSVINQNLDLSIKVASLAADPSNDQGYEISYTGAEEIYTIPYSGTYIIEAAGAEGTQGNKFGNADSNIAPGKGAIISGEFDFKVGDKLHLVVGGMGSTTSATGTDGTSGAGGGGSFVFKEISEITDTRYQFSKNSINMDTLLVAAGGGGTGDLGYSSTKTKEGYNGNSIDFKSPSNFVAYSTASNSGASAGNSTPLSITQYISYDLRGGIYTRNSGVCNGGFGGGGCQDDDRSYGGGWSGTSNISYSWSQGQNTIGSDSNFQSGNGYIKIKLKK